MFFNYFLSWTVNSMLRYLYIAHNDWLEAKFPNPKTLRNISLSVVTIIFVTLLVITYGSLAVIAMPFNWPEESFITNGSTSAKLTLAFVCLAVFLLPVFVTCGLHILLLYSRSFKGNNRIGIFVCHQTNTHLEELSVRNAENLSEKENDADKPSDANQRSSVKDKNDSCPIEDDKIRVVESKEDCSQHEDIQKENVVLENGVNSEPHFNSDQEIPTNIAQVVNSKSLSLNDSKIQVQVDSIQVPVNTFSLNDDIESPKLDIDDPERRKVEAEIESAIRSLKPNLILIFLLLFLVTFFLFSPLEWQLYSIATIESLEKSLLPTLTTMANFNPIRLVISKYYNYLKFRFSNLF